MRWLPPAAWLLLLLFLVPLSARAQWGPIVDDEEETPADTTTPAADEGPSLVPTLEESVDTPPPVEEPPPPVAEQTAPAEGERLMVLDMIARNVDPELVALVGDELVTALRDMGGFEVVSQSEVRTMLSVEAQRQLVGCTDDTCLTEIAGALGANQVITGTVAGIGDVIQVKVKRLNTAEARVVSERSTEALDLTELRDQVRETTFLLMGAPYQARKSSAVAWPRHTLGVHGGAIVPLHTEPGPIAGLRYLYRSRDVNLGGTVTYTQVNTSVNWDDAFEPYDEAVAIRALLAGLSIQSPATGGEWVRAYFLVDLGILWVSAESLATDAPRWVVGTGGNAFAVYAQPGLGLRLLPRSSFGLSFEASWLFSAGDTHVYDRAQPLAREVPPKQSGTPNKGRMFGPIFSGVVTYGF